MNRWWTYQAERFPLAAHLPLIAAFAASAIAFSALLTGARWDWHAFALAFPVCAGFFLQLRIADEFKDFEDDSRWRPYRAVPRGLVKLRELGILFAAIALGQLGLTLWLQPALIWLLLLGWAYLAAMSFEFGARRWLKARPLWYLFTHMGIMPLVDLFATATLWQRVLPQGHPPLLPLILFLAASFGNGLVLEFGRKLRAPADEEEGVETYTALWGTSRAPLAWLAALTTTGALALSAAAQVHILQPAVWILPPLWLAAAALAFRFRRRPQNGKRFELAAALWTLAFYLSLGPIPLLLPHF